jgi:hypothetical protein
MAVLAGIKFPFVSVAIRWSTASWPREVSRLHIQNTKTNRRAYRFVGVVVVKFGISGLPSVRNTITVL